MSAKVRVTTLSRRKRGFDSPWGRQISAIALQQHSALDYPLRRTTGAPRLLATSISLSRMRRNSLAGRNP